MSEQVLKKFTYSVVGVLPEGRIVNLFGTVDGLCAEYGRRQAVRHFQRVFPGVHIVMSGTLPVGAPVERVPMEGASGAGGF